VKPEVTARLDKEQEAQYGKSLIGTTGDVVIAKDKGILIEEQEPINLNIESYVYSTLRGVKLYRSGRRTYFSRA